LPNFSLRKTLFNLCTTVFGVGFFLPWAHFFGAEPSGFDLQKLGGEHRLLWLIPFFLPSQSSLASPNAA
jgi:hypothetical protein